MSCQLPPWNVGVGRVRVNYVVKEMEEVVEEGLEGMDRWTRWKAVGSGTTSGSAEERRIQI